MNDAEPQQVARHVASPDSALFAWRGGGIVLFAERSDQRWIVARGWLRRDRLVDVRRWSFPTPAALAAQIRRLAHEATGDVPGALLAAEAVLAWAAEAESPVDRGPEP